MTAAAAAAAAGAGDRNVLDQLGVQKTATGHRFTLFAPNAKRVELAVNVAQPHTPFTELFALEPCGAAGEAKGCWQGRSQVCQRISSTSIGSMAGRSCSIPMLGP